MADLSRLAGRRAITVAVGYGLLAGAYIVASSLFLGGNSEGARSHAHIETLKGLGFVLATAIGLGFVVHRDYLIILDAKAKLGASAAALARAQSAATLPLLAGAIAHDMRNLVGAAMTNLDFIEPESADEDAKEALHDVRESLERLSAFATELMQRSGRSASAYPVGKVDLPAVVGDCVRLTALFARGHKCEIETSCSGDCTVHARRQEIECVVLNLLLNALDANQLRGKISVACERSADGVIVRVRDQGPGVPKELAEKIFDPFFTTKGENGNGIGLSVTRGLLRSYGGDVRLSDPGPGAEFEARLPVAS